MDESGVPTLADRDVLRLVRKGHVDYFRILVDRYQSRVFSIGMRFLRNREDALDFSQEVFLKAFDALPGFRGEKRGGSFGGWLTTIAYRHGINSVKRRTTYISLAEDFEPAGGISPEADRFSRRIKDVLAEAAAGLAEGQRMCIDLAFFYGLRYGEISEITGIPVNTVKSHIFRGKKLLKEKLLGTEAEDYHDL